LQENLPFLKVEPSFSPRTSEKKEGLDKSLDHQLKASLQESTSVIITVRTNKLYNFSKPYADFFLCCGKPELTRNWSYENIYKIKSTPLQAS